MKYCAEQGCRKLISSGRYCDDHKRRRKKKAWHSNYKSFYNSTAWKDLRSFIYQRDRGLCQRCGKFVFGKDAHCHHIIPISEAPELKLHPDNIKLLCPECHVIEEEKIRDKNMPKYFKTVK